MTTSAGHENEATARGVITRLVRDRGYGFIRGEGSEDIFFHRSALSGEDFWTLSDGQPVQFRLVVTPRGLRAVSVHRASDATGSGDARPGEAGQDAPPPDRHRT